MQQCMFGKQRCSASTTDASVLAHCNNKGRSRAAQQTESCMRSRARSRLAACCWYEYSTAGREYAAAHAVHIAALVSRAEHHASFPLLSTQTLAKSGRRQQHPRSFDKDTKSVRTCPCIINMQHLVVFLS
jgi:hypothetical protein